MSKLFNHLKRGGSGVIAGALVSLALAGTAVAAPAASAGIFSCNWQQLSLMNGWQPGGYNTGNPAVCALDNGMVYLSGSLAQPTAGSNEFAVLPSWARPAHNLYLSVYTYQGTDGIVEIDTTGVMWAYNAQYQGDTKHFTSLAGISFPAAGAAAEAPLPLLNGWKSAQSKYGTGDPSYSVIDGVVHMNGSLDGSQVATSTLIGAVASTFAVLPQGARPDTCSAIGTYDYYGAAGTVQIESNGTLHSYTGQEIDGVAAKWYTSLAGVSFPAAGTVNWLPLTLQGGWGPDWTNCPSDHPNPYAPSYAVLNGVVYLTGLAYQYPTPSGSVVGVLPAGARPTHDLYLNVETGGTSNAYMHISPDGQMYVWFKDNSTGVSLTGLSFQLNS